MTALAHRICAAAVRLLHERRGAVIIEMAFAIPFLVLVGFAGMEIANLTLTNTRISQIGLSAADNASRIAFGSALSQPQIRERDINDVFAGVEEQARGLGFKANGRIILSSLEQNTGGGQWIHWQRCYGNLKVQSSYGKEDDGALGKPTIAGMGTPGQEVTAATGTAVMFVEIVYEYQPLLYGKWLGKRQVRTKAAFNIREGRDLTTVYNLENATVSTCT